MELAGDDGDLDLALGRLEVVGHQVAGADVLGRLEKYSKKKNFRSEFWTKNFLKIYVQITFGTSNKIPLLRRPSSEWQSGL